MLSSTDVATGCFDRVITRFGRGYARDMNTLLKASAVSYLVIGVAGLLKPERIPALFGGVANSPDARTEVRAVYAGIPLAIAGLVMTRPAQSALPGAALSAGMAMGRLTGMSLEKQSSPATRFFLGVEATLALAMLVGSRQAVQPTAMRTESRDLGLLRA